MRGSLLAALIFGSTAVGCTGAPTGTTRQVGGQVDVNAYALDNAKIIATTADGRRFVAALDRTGRFSITLPTNVRYRIAIANSSLDGSSHEIGIIGWQGASGRSHGVSLGAGAAIELGSIHPAGSNATLKSLSHGGDDSSGGSGGGGETEPAENETEDEDHSIPMCANPGNADLPYDVRPQVGDSFKLGDAFLARGPLPAEVLDVTMDGDDWHLADLKSGAAFTITQADCDHVGNRDTGRDRIFVTWKNADGSTATDHLDLRYCKGGGGSGSGSASVSTSSTDGTCEDGGTPVCSQEDEVESECEHGDHENMDVTDPSDAPATDPCAMQPGDTPDGGTEPGSSPDPTTAGTPDPLGNCIVDASCDAGLICVASRCVPLVN